MKSFTLMLIVSMWFSQTASATSEGFSIEKEFGARQLVNAFVKKYNMDLKVKRTKGDLLIRVRDNSFFTSKGKITRPGARFVRKLAHYLCGELGDCKIGLTAHHFEEGYVSRRDLLKKSQKKLTAVLPQVITTSVSPANIVQVAAGDSKPLKDLDINEYASPSRIAGLNTRFELQFVSYGDGYDQ